MSILPSYLVSSLKEQIDTSSVIEIPREYEIDFETGQMTGRIVEGIDAIQVWIWSCLHTQRFRYPIYSWNYGADLEQYIGKALTDEYLETELESEIEDALKVNSYITGIENYSFERASSKVHITFSVRTTLGDNIEEEYDAVI